MFMRFALNPLVVLMMTATVTLGALAAAASAEPAAADPAPAPALQRAGSGAVEAAPDAAAAPEEEAEPADSSAGLFVGRCSGCHTIGGGKLNGPDLVAAAKWPDSTLDQAVRKMVKHVGPLTDADVATLVAFIKDPAAPDRIAAERKRSMQAMAARLDPPSPETGRSLFMGEIPFQNAGMSCVACHQAGDRGGALGPDLTNLAAKMDRIAMMSAFEKAAFPVMKTAYRDHPVTTQEALHIAVWLESVKPAGEPATVTPTEAAAVPLTGVGLAAALLALLALSCARPRAGQVRQRLLDKSRNTRRVRP